MSKFSGLCLVSFKVQNSLSSLEPLEVLLGFFDLLRQKSKMENGNHFGKKKCMVISSIIQYYEPKPRIFGDKRGTKHPLSKHTRVSKLNICSNMDTSKPKTSYLLWTSTNYYYVYTVYLY